MHQDILECFPLCLCSCVSVLSLRQDTAEAILSQITRQRVKPHCCGTPLNPEATGFQFAVAADFFYVSKGS